MLPSNDWYPALTQPNVELVPHGLAAVEGATALGADGSRHEVDVIIFGTGFEVADPGAARLVVGPAGRSLAQVWAEQGRAALRSTTVAGFPNLFLMLGPNSGLGHSSMVFQVESQTAYIADAIAAMTAHRLAAIEPRPEAQSRYNDTLQRRMQRTVWQTGGCRSWYQDADGRNTALWPASTLRFRRNTRAIDLAEYRLRRLDP